MTKILILFYSSHGTNRTMAEIAQQALEGYDVRLRRIPETAPADIIKTQEAWHKETEIQKDIPPATGDDIVWADGIFFSLPTRFGNIPSQAQAFFDTLGGLWFEGKLSGKAVTATTAAGSVNGGQEATILSLYKSLMHWGSIIVPAGYGDQSIFDAGGNPYGTSQTGATIDEPTRKAITFQAKQMAAVAAKLR